jgi:hypothetical protein
LILKWKRWAEGACMRPWVHHQHKERGGERREGGGKEREERELFFLRQGYKALYAVGGLLVYTVPYNCTCFML